MPQPSLAVSHVLEQLALHRARRRDQDRRPAWLSALIDAAAELFDPVRGVGRVGFECRPTERGWAVALYLGADELVGGPDDGRTHAAPFAFDLLGLTRLFDAVESLTFDAAGGRAEEASGGPAGVTVRGTVSGRAVLLTVHAAPPAGVKPAFRQYPNGRREVSE